MNTLIEISNKPANNLLAIGVVLDSTSSYKTLNSLDYITKIKIVDETLNANAPNSYDNKYIHIFIYSKNLSDEPKVF